MSMDRLKCRPSMLRFIASWAASTLMPVIETNVTSLSCGIVDLLMTWPCRVSVLSEQSPRSLVHIVSVFVNAERLTTLQLGALSHGDVNVVIV